MSDAAHRFLNSPAGTDAWFAAWRELEANQVQQKRMQEQVIQKREDLGREPPRQERDHYDMDLSAGPHSADRGTELDMGRDLRTDIRRPVKDWDGPDA